MASLVVMGPPSTGSRFPLCTQREFVIGRSGFCDIVLNKRSISREHARIFERGGDYFVVDLDSVNGTFLNGRPIHDVARLTDGDRINLYDVPLRFYLFDDPKTPSSGSIPTFAGGEVPPRGEPQLRARLDNVLDIVHQLGSNLDVDVILPNVLNILFHTFPQAGNGQIMLVEKDGSLSPRATKQGLTADSATLTDVPTNHELSRRALETGASLIDNSGDASGDSALDSNFASTMFVPIIIGPTRTPLGIIVLETEDPENRFSQEDLQLVTGIATITGQAIGYARAHEVVVDHERTRHHLETAREIQLRMLPRETPQIPNYSFAQFYRAAQLVGGDAYSYHTLPDGRIMFAVADASGKGLPASLRIAEFVSELRHCVSTAKSLKSAMDDLNRFVYQADGGFITFCLAVLDPERNTLSIANAGHPTPRLRHQDGTVVCVGTDRVCFPLGLVPDNPCHPLTLTLNIGEELVLFTDGVTEAFNRESELYGAERLHQSLKFPAATVSERMQTLIADVERFRQGSKPNDDQCILIVRRTE